MQKIFCILFLFFLLASCNNEKNTHAHNSTNERLDLYFNHANNDTLDIKKRKEYVVQILEIISKQPTDSMQRVNYFKVANRYFNMNDMESYKKISEKIIAISDKEQDSVSLAKAYSYLGDYYNNKLISDSAYYTYSKSQRIYTKLKDYSKVGKILLNKSIIQYNEGDLIGSEKTALDAIKMLRKSSDPELIYQCHNVLGVLYNELEEFDMSISSHKQALKIANLNQLPKEYQSSATSLNNLGYVYKRMGKYDIALDYFTQALNKKDIYIDKPFLYASLKENIGALRMKYEIPVSFNSVKKLFTESLQIRDSLKIIPGIIGVKLNFSELYLSYGIKQPAFTYAKEAYELSKQHNRAKDKLSALKQLISVDPDNIKKYSEEYLHVYDSIQLAERQVRNKLARIEFETEELSLQKDILVEQRKKIIYTALSIMILGVFIYIIRFQITKNRELKLIQEQQMANEEIYQLMISQQDVIEEVRESEKKKIAIELHDGILGKLFGTRLNLGLLNNSNAEKDINSRTIFIEELKNIEQQIREISHDLSSEKTAIHNNFVLMVTNFIEGQKHLNQYKINYHMSNAIDWSLINNTVKINLYRILQEAFQNINKHSNATIVLVTFAIEDHIIIVRIEDNGVGFDPLKKKKGIGLQNMNSRIQASNSSMKIDSEIGAGTLITIEIPINIPN